MLNGTKEAIPQQINVAVLLFITEVRVAPTKWIIFLFDNYCHFTRHYVSAHVLICFVSYFTAATTRIILVQSLGDGICLNSVKLCMLNSGASKCFIFITELIRVCFQIHVHRFIEL